MQVRSLVHASPSAVAPPDIRTRGQNLPVRLGCHGRSSIFKVQHHQTQAKPLCQPPARLTGALAGPAMAAFHITRPGHAYPPERACYRIYPPSVSDELGGSWSEPWQHRTGPKEFTIPLSLPNSCPVPRRGDWEGVVFKLGAVPHHTGTSHANPELAGAPHG
jgi:hypothetical protein